MVCDPVPHACRDVNEAILDAAVMLQAPRASLNVLCASR